MTDAPTWTKEKIRGLREQAEMTQEQFAITVGVSLSTMQNWEYGICSPRKRQAEALERFRDSEFSDGDLSLLRKKAVELGLLDYTLGSILSAFNERAQEDVVRALLQAYAKGVAKGG